MIPRKLKDAADRDNVDIGFSDSEITLHQQALADAVERILLAHARYERIVRPNCGNGPSVDFVIQLKLPHISVSLTVYQDSFHITANGASMFIELGEVYDQWTEDVVEATRALISGPLRIRVRRTLFLRRPVGAIFLGYDQGAGWNGDLSAIRGAGEEATFPDWYEPASGP